MLKKINQLLDKWNSSGKLYIHWKSTEHIVTSLEGKEDLDVLLDERDKDFWEESLSSLGFFKPVIQDCNVYEGVEEWLGNDEEEGKMIHVHLHYNMVTGHKFVKEYFFPVTELAFETRVLHETGIFVINPNLEIIILYSRMVLKKPVFTRRYTTKGYRAEIDYLKERVNTESMLDFAEKLYEEDSVRFVDYILKGNLEQRDFAHLKKIIDKHLTRFKRHSNFYSVARSVYFKYRNFFRKVMNSKFGCQYISKKKLPGRGVAICFIGSDACGKSTLSKDVIKWLGWKLDCKRFYLGTGDGKNTWDKKLLQKMSKTSGSKEAKHIKSQGDSKPKKQKLTFKLALKSLVYSIYALRSARSKYKTLKAAQQYINKGGIAIFDRFPQSQFEGIYDGPNISAKYGQFFKSLPLVKFIAKKEVSYFEKCWAMQPDVLFRLSVPLEVAMARKPEENEKAVARKIEITHKLIFPDTVQVYDIDATMDYKLESAYIKDCIWKMLV